MKRVAIVGTPGSGKSTLARELGERTELPVIHLDRHYFLPGWERKPDEEWDALAGQLLAGDEWVMDGAFAMEKAVARADTVVFLDLSRRRAELGGQALRRSRLRSTRNPRGRHGRLRMPTDEPAHQHRQRTRRSLCRVAKAQ
jgi:adenylate kinase family enzyme